MLITRCEEQLNVLRCRPSEGIAPHPNQSSDGRRALSGALLPQGQEAHLGRGEADERRDLRPAHETQPWEGLPRARGHGATRGPGPTHQQGLLRAPPRGPAWVPGWVQRRARRPGVQRLRIQGKSMSLICLQPPDVRLAGLLLDDVYIDETGKCFLDDLDISKCQQTVN